MTAPLLVLASFLTAVPQSPAPRITVDYGAAFTNAPLEFQLPGLPIPSVVTKRVTFKRTDAAAAVVVALKASVTWLKVPEVIAVGGDGASMTVIVDSASAPRQEMSTATIEFRDGGPTGTLLGTIPVGLLRAVAGGSTPVTVRRQMPGASFTRIFFPTDTGRGIFLNVSRDSSAAVVSAVVAGQVGPVRALGDTGALTVQIGQETPVVIDASDIQGGVYQVTLFNEPARATGVRVDIVRSPVRLGATVVAGNIKLTAQNLMDTAVTVRFRVGLIGAGTSRHLTGRGATPIRVAFPVPLWASAMVLDMITPTTGVRPDSIISEVTRPGGGGSTWNLSVMNHKLFKAIEPKKNSDSVVVMLTPTFIRAAPTQSWSVDIELRYVAEVPAEIDPGGSPMRTAARGATVSETFPMKIDPSRALPSGFDPIVQIVAIDTERDWWRTLRLNGFNRP